MLKVGKYVFNCLQCRQILLRKLNTSLSILPPFFLPENKMDVHNMATVFSPNLVHSETPSSRRPESIMFEMEWNNRLIEKLILHVNEIFENYTF